MVYAADTDRCCSTKPQHSALWAEFQVLWFLYVATLFDQYDGEFILAYRRRALPINLGRYYYFGTSLATCHWIS